MAEAWHEGSDGACVWHAGEHGGLKLTANARAALMQRLSGQAAPANGMPGKSCIVIPDLIVPLHILTSEILQACSSPKIDISITRIALWYQKIMQIVPDQLLGCTCCVCMADAAEMWVQRCCQGRLQWCQQAP